MDEDAQQSAAKIRRQPVYTVRIREQTFRLSESQIHFDTPNYFSLAFSDDWIEGETREIDILDRNPELFRTYIVDWLAGYELPWTRIQEDRYLLTNLVRDARFYALSQLEQRLCNEPVQKEFFSYTGDWRVQPYASPSGNPAMLVTLRDVGLLMGHGPSTTFPGPLSRLMLSIKDYPSDWARRLCKEAGGRNKPQIETDLYQNYGQFDMETVSTSVIDDTGSWRGNLQEVFRAMWLITDIPSADSLSERQIAAVQPVRCLLERNLPDQEMIGAQAEGFSHWHWHAAEISFVMELRGEAGTSTRSWIPVNLRSLELQSVASRSRWIRQQERRSEQASYDWDAFIRQI